MSNSNLLDYGEVPGPWSSEDCDKDEDTESIDGTEDDREDCIGTGHVENELDRYVEVLLGKKAGYERTVRLNHRFLC